MKVLSALFLASVGLGSIAAEPTKPDVFVLHLRVMAPSSINVDQMKVRVVNVESAALSEKILNLREVIHTFSHEELQEVIRSIDPPSKDSKAPVWIHSAHIASDGWRSFTFEGISQGPHRIELLAAAYQRGGIYPFFGGWRRLKGSSFVEIDLKNPRVKELFVRAQLDRAHENTDNMTIRLDKIEEIP